MEVGARELMRSHNSTQDFAHNRQSRRVGQARGQNRLRNELRSMCSVDVPHRRCPLHCFYHSKVISASASSADSSLAVIDIRACSLTRPWPPAAVPKASDCSGAALYTTTAQESDSVPGSPGLGSSPQALRNLCTSQIRLELMSVYQRWCVVI